MGGNILNQVYSGRLTAASPSIDLAALGLLLGRICFAADFLLFGARKFSDPSIIYKLIVAHHLAAKTGPLPVSERQTYPRCRPRNAPSDSSIA